MPIQQAHKIMKKIDLKIEFKTLTGQRIVIDDGSNPLTLKIVLLNMIGMHQAANGEEAIKLYDIGIRINQSNNSIELEDSDFELVKKIVDLSKVLASIVTAQVLKYFKELEEVKHKQGKE